MYIQTYRRDKPDDCATRRTHTCMHACMHFTSFPHTFHIHVYVIVCTCKYPFVYMHLHDR